MPADRVALIQNNGYSRDKNGGCRLVEFAEKIKEPGTGKLEAEARGSPSAAAPRICFAFRARFFSPDFIGVSVCPDIVPPAAKIPGHKHLNGNCGIIHTVELAS